ncbi:MAG: nodulation protein NfeD [Parvularculaceae bacterium]|nr:MAG: nodulation protein NfeD [Parvularculaceae bacterium]
MKRTDFGPASHDHSRQSRIWVLVVTAFLGVAGLILAATGDTVRAQQAPANGVILTLEGPVTPPMADYLAREIKAASDAGAEAVILEIDTPGGLVDSMKTIIKAILASDTPVITYVSPQGARSASAGLYITYASHLAAMAPFTNTGAATPVEIGGASPSDENPFEGETPFPDEPGAPVGDEGSDADPANPADISEAAGDDEAETVSPLSNSDAMRAKIINDSVAYIRSLAEGRGRNADWAERAVREGVSVTATEALEIGVVEIVAEDLEDLLKQANGRVVQTQTGEKTITTTNLALTRVMPQLIEQILGFIANPNVAAILLTLGTTGLIAEIWNPGSVFPGAMGIICLLLAFYALQMLPFNWLGIALMIVGLVLITLEAYTPTFGISGLAGFISFAAGLFLIFPEGFEVSRIVIATTLVILGGILGLILVAIVGSRNHGPLIGGDAIKRREGLVDEWNGQEGWVIVEGERWRARADRPLQPGDKIKVIEVDGLVLVVKQAKAYGLLGGLTPSDA